MEDDFDHVLLDDVSLNPWFHVQKLSGERNSPLPTSAGRLNRVETSLVLRSRASILVQDLNGVLLAELVDELELLAPHFVYVDIQGVTLIDKAGILLQIPFFVLL